MIENSLHVTEERLSKRRVVSSDTAYERGADSWSFRQGGTASLLRAPTLSGHGNTPTRSQLLLGAQRTHGNRAVQRLMRSNASTPHNVLPVQRVPTLDWATDWVSDKLADAYDWTEDKVTGAYDKVKGAHDWLKELDKRRPRDFNDLAAGGVDLKDAPEKITLPKELQDGMKKAWAASLPGGKAQEQGGILVRDSNYNYKWREGKPLPLDQGGSGSFIPNYGDREVDEKLMTVGHTHPYAKDEGGHTNVTFGGPDLGKFLYSPEKMQMVQSGDGQFVSVRTAEFDKMVSGLDYYGKHELAEKMQEEYAAILSDPDDKRPLPERTRDATIALSRKYHLLYYEGKGGELALQGRKARRMTMGETEEGF